MLPASSRYSRFRHFAAAGMLAAICGAGASTAAGAEPIRFWSGGDKPANLVEAVGAGDLALVNTMLAEGADVNAIGSFDRNRRDTTPLIVAASTGHLQMVEALLAARAQVDATQTGWQTPLMFAAATGRADIGRLLLARGASTTAKDARGRTALMLATERNDRELVELLAGAGSATTR